MEKTVAYSCPYVPAEWIAAHGLRPARVLCSSAHTNGPMAAAEGVCHYVRCFISTLEQTKPDAIVLTTLCDQMRRAFDIVTRDFSRPAILLNIPTTMGDNALRMYQDELKRLSRFLCQIGGRTPSDDLLSETMLKFDNARKSLAALQQPLGPRKYTEAIAAFNSNPNGQADSDRTYAKPQYANVPLALVGGPMLKEDFELFDLVESAGGTIVLDATETGERGLCPSYDTESIKADPMAELARAYLHGIPDVSRRPNDMLYNWLRTRLQERNVRGIILKRHLWCDLWHAELSRIRDTFDIPVLDIDSAGDPDALRSRDTNRINAFLEMFT